MRIYVHYNLIEIAWKELFNIILVINIIKMIKMIKYGNKESCNLTAVSLFCFCGKEWFISLKLCWAHFKPSYRVSHETWQLVNSFEWVLNWILKTFYCSFRWKNIFSSNLFYFEINFTIIWLPYNIFIILFSIKQLN